MPVVADQQLDTRGWRCPLPLLRTKEIIKGMIAGQILEIISDDPASTLDFKAFTAQTGHVLLAINEDIDQYHFFIQRVKTL